MASQAHFRGRTIAFDIRRRHPALALVIDGKTHEIREIPGTGGAVEIFVDGRRFSGWRHVVGNEVHVRLDGRTFRVTLIDHRSDGGGAGKAGNAIYAEMPGTVIELRCGAGNSVVTGQSLLTIESMKLQMTIVAPFDGTVEAVHVAPQASFEREALLVSLRPAVPPDADE